MDDFLDFIAEMYPDAIAADGLDQAIIGVVEVDGIARLIYSREKVIDTLMTRDGMDYDTAVDFADFNIFCAYWGPTTPLFALCPPPPAVHAP